MSDLLIPSYSQGYAQYQADAENPDRWDGLAFNWHGPLGPTGVVAKDVSGRGGGDGVLTNMDPATDWVMTEKGWALDFDGINQMVLFPTLPVTLNSAAFSLAAWVFPKAGSDTIDGIVRTRDGDQNGAHLIGGAGTIRFGLTDGGGGKLLSVAGAGYTNGAWHHVCGVAVNGFMHLYLDGKEVGTPLAYTPPVVNETMVPQLGEHNGNFNTASIATGTIWNRALTPSEIQKLFTDEHATVRAVDDSPLAQLTVDAAAAQANHLMLMGMGV